MTEQRFLFLGVTALAVGLFFSLSSFVFHSAEEPMGLWDVEASEQLRLRQTPRLTQVAVAVTHLGDGIVLTPLVILAGLVFQWRRHPRAFVLLAASGIGAFLFSQGLKAFYRRLRPDSVLHLVTVQGFSYPSGHSLAATAVYLTLARLITQTRVSPVLKFLVLGGTTVLVSAIGVSRIYLGVHYLSDVLGGACLGVALAAFLAAIDSHFAAKAAPSGEPNL